jgi:hypothetical protein
VSALDRRWVRYLVRLAIFVASLPVAAVLTVGFVTVFSSGEQWGLMHSSFIVFFAPVLALALYAIGHLATSRWPQP